MRRIQKRDGNLQEFQPRKIARAMLMAFQEVGPEKLPDIRPLLDEVVQELPEDLIPIEDIQDQIEEVLMKNYPEVARAFVIYREKRAEARAARQRPKPEWIADYIHAGKYAKYREDLGRREVYEETVERDRQMHLTKYKDCGEDLIKEINWAFDLVAQKKVFPSMRSMQFGGPAILKKNARIYNCSFTLVDRIRVFQEIFWLLLCGCGVGYSVQLAHVDKLPRLNRVNEEDVRHFVIPDTIEGWADSLGELFKSYMEGYYVEFAYHEIRSEGEALQTSGGKAPGHIPLKRCLERVRKILRTAEGRKLRSIECHDIICHVAEAVLAGGIRRSSLICLFSPEDTEMLYAKSAPGFNPKQGVNLQRMMANNSAIFLRDRVTRDEFNRVLRIANEGFGEPGFFFTCNLDFGTNPCSEIGLNPTYLTLSPKHHAPVRLTGFAFCNLTEVVAANCNTKKEFLEACRAASIIGTLQAGFTDFDYLTDVTKLIAEREALIGVGITGMVDKPDIALDPQTQREGAQLVVKTNQQIARAIGISPAARCTTIKPSGTSSLEAGCVGSGIHPHHARRYFRRITANPLEAPAQFFREHNPHAVEYKENGDWSLIFPVEVPDNAITVKEEPAEDFMERVFSTYENWVVPGTARPDSSEGLTHNVSCTVTVRPEEQKYVEDTVWQNRHRIAAMSFAPYTLDTIYPYAPREEITDDARWNELIKLWKPIDWSEFKEESDETDLALVPACEGDKCTI